MKTVFPASRLTKTGILSLLFVLILSCGSEVVSQPTDNAPQIEQLQVAPVQLRPGQSALATARAYDPDGDVLTYLWEATDGSFDAPSALETTFRAPESSGSVTITFHAQDKSHDIRTEFLVEVLSPAEEDQDGDGVVDGDCSPGNADIYPGALEVPDGLDNDCDGDIDEGTSSVDDDGDGYSERNGDCDDSDEAVYPGNVETEDGRDNDCDGLVDEGSASADDDGDGFSEDQGDCVDARGDVNPLGTEAPDGADNDCDGAVDEGTVTADDDGDGYSEQLGDCNDEDPLVYPGASETSSFSVDNDCDGLVDEGTTRYDDDGDGWSEVKGDCDDEDPSRNPLATESFNGRDDDCDGFVDEGTSGFDDDGDGFSELEGDCDDRAAVIYPGQQERANGLDDDCDGTVDEATARYDDDGDGQSEEGGDCDDRNHFVRAGLPESADGLDNNCDRQIDEGTGVADDDGDGFSELHGDCNDADPSVFPGAIDLPEDGIDNACTSTPAIAMPEAEIREVGMAEECLPRTFQVEVSQTSPDDHLWFDWFVALAPYGSQTLAISGQEATFLVSPDLPGRYIVGVVASNFNVAGPASYAEFDASECGAD